MTLFDAQEPLIVLIRLCGGHVLSYSRDRLSFLGQALLPVWVYYHLWRTPLSQIGEDSQVY